jgi:hypothetical protein
MLRGRAAAFLAAVLLIVAAGTAARAQRPAADPFRGDRRLLAPTAFQEQDRPLRDLLEELSAKLDVRLTATTDTGDDRITLFLHERPAAEALALIAEHLDFQWRRRGDGFELGQDLRSRQREALLREQEFERLLVQLRRMAEIGAWPREKREQYLRDAIATLQRNELPKHEEERLSREIGSFANEKSAEVVAALLPALSSQQLAHLRNSGFLRLSSGDGSLPPRLASITHGAIDVHRAELRAMLEEFGGQTLGPRNETAPVRADVVLYLEREAIGSGTHQAGAQQELVLKASLHSLRGTLEEPNSGPSLGAWVQAVPAPPAREAEPSAADPALQREVQIPPGAPVAEPPASAAGTEAQRWAPGMLTLGELCEALHRQAGLEVVADSFVRARVHRELASGRRTARHLLDLASTHLEYEWRQEETILRLRNRHHYNDRPAEVPERVLAPVREAVLARGFGLDDLARFAAVLTDAQCRGLDDYWGWYFEGTGMSAGPFYPARRHLRFWNTLNPAQRQHVLRDEQIVVRQLDVNQRQALLAVLADPGLPTPILVALPLNYPSLILPDGNFTVTSSAGTTQGYAGTDGRARIVTTPDGPASTGEERASFGERIGPVQRYVNYTFRYHGANKPGPVLWMDFSLRGR